jgi:hypothetical protein
MRLEPPVWDAWTEMLGREGLSESEAITQAQHARGPGSRTSDVRMLLLSYYRAAATDEGHQAAGHGLPNSQPIFGIDD